ncbi:MAG TPA: hypothetical protein VI455_16100, partial [Terriglobia bacterium]
SQALRLDPNRGPDPGEHCPLRPTHISSSMRWTYITNHWDRRLASLDPEIRERVLRWAAVKFSVKLTQTEKPAARHDTRKESEEKGELKESSSFNDFASLYDATNATTEADKALVVGYWLQVTKGNPDWTGFSANRELKNLGHGVDNITVALGQLIGLTPRLVMQTHKAGKTKQAHKKYKLTNEGIKRVKQMLADSAAGGSEDGGKE